MISVTSRANDNIKLYAKLLSSPKERKRSGLFVLEGVRLIADAVSSGIMPETVFVTERGLNKEPSLISACEERGCRMFLVTDDIAEYISDTENPQGMFAVCRRRAEKKASDIIRQGGKYIILWEVRDPGNMGTVIRTADAVGIDGIICKGCCDIYSPKTIRAAMGSVLHTDIAAADEDIFGILSAAGIKSFAAVVDSLALPVNECDFSAGGAVFIGNEGNGLPQSVADNCTFRMTIPMKGRANSLNAAAAAGIIMWEFTK